MVNIDELVEDWFNGQCKRVAIIAAKNASWAVEICIKIPPRDWDKFRRLLQQAERGQLQE